MSNQENMILINNQKKAPIARPKEICTSELKFRLSCESAANLQLEHAIKQLSEIRKAINYLNEEINRKIDVTLKRKKSS